MMFCSSNECEFNWLTDLRVHFLFGVNGANRCNELRCDIPKSIVDRLRCEHRHSWHRFNVSETDGKYLFSGMVLSCQNKLVWVSCSCSCGVGRPVGQHFSSFIYLHLSGCHLKTIIYRYFICGKYFFHRNIRIQLWLWVSSAVRFVQSNSLVAMSRVACSRKCAKIVVLPRSHIIHSNHEHKWTDEYE